MRGASGLLRFAPGSNFHGSPARIELSARSGSMRRRRVAVYALIVAKGGAKIQPATEDGSPGGGLSMKRGTAGADVAGRKLLMLELVHFLSDQVGRTVLDKTSLKGNYDFKMNFAPDRGLGQPPDPDAPSIFTALQEQLGLKLDAQKGPVEVLVIDSAQKPSAN